MGRNHADGSLPALIGRAQPDRWLHVIGQALMVLAPLLTVALMVRYVAAHEFAVDFTHSFWVAASRVLHGDSPYIWSASELRAGVGFPYPALAGFVLAPFALVSSPVAAAVFVTLLLGALVCSFPILGIRDARLIAVAFLWWPVINAWQTANMTLLLVLVVAIAWHWRDRPGLLGALVAAAVTLKPMLWPLVIWLIVTYRWRALITCALVGLVANLTAFALVGFGEIHRYLSLSNQLTVGQYHDGYGVIAIVLRLGGSPGIAWALLTAASGSVAALCWHAARKGNDRAVLRNCLTLALVASPVVWNHYFALLLVPLCISRPRLGWLWLLPLAYWLCPATGVSEWQALLAAAVTAALNVALARDGVCTPAPVSVQPVVLGDLSLEVS